MVGIVGGLLIVICFIPSDMAKFCLLRYFPYFSLVSIHTHHDSWSWIEITGSRTYPESLVGPVGKASVSFVENKLLILLLICSETPCVRKYWFSRPLESCNLHIISAMACVCVVNSPSAGSAIKPVLNREIPLSGCWSPRIANTFNK